MQESTLTCGAKCNNKLKDVPRGREKTEGVKCPHTADAPYRTTIINMEWEKQHSL